MLLQDSLGLDIRHDRVLMVLLRGGFKGPSSSSHSFYGLDPELPDRKRLAAIGGFLEEFRKENHIGASHHLFIGIPGDVVMVRELSYPLSVRENLPATLRYEMEKHVPLSAEDVFFDCQVLAEDKARGRLNALLVVAKRDALAPYLEFAAGLRGGGASGMEGVDTARANAWAFLSARGGRMSASEAAALKEDASAEEEKALAVEARLPGAEYLPALGLALRGIRETPLAINLLPPGIRRRPSRRGIYAMAALLALCILGGVVWSGTVFFRQRADGQAMDAELARLEGEVAGIRSMQERIDAARSRLEALRALDRGHVPLIELLRELTERIPDSAWVRDFSYSERGIQINGFAESASELIGVLEASPFFRNAAFLSAIVRDPEGLERFSIRMEIESQE
jgi:Tfp pilus assembly protein PilN/Tfp pilus assembly PilM family ATPase